MVCSQMKTHFCEGAENIKVGFIFSYPSSKEEKEGKPIYGEFGASFNNLLCKLNKKYPQMFPYNEWRNYRITNTFTKLLLKEHQGLHDLNTIGKEENIERIKDEIKDLNTVICFGEKANFAVKKAIKNFDLDIHVIKVDNINPSPISRHIALLNKSQAPRIRTDFKILDIFNKIVNQLN